MQDDSPSFEGILVGLFAGHYQLAKPAIVETSDRTVDVHGDAWVSRDRVLFVQVLS